MLSTAFILLLAAQAHAVAPKTVSSVEDIEIGMGGDVAIAGLTKAGYTLKDLFAGAGTAAADSQEWEVSYEGKEIGTFSVVKGRVADAEIQVYDSQDPPSGGSGAIGLGEALYWILYDNGSPLRSEGRSFRETGTDAQFTTREVERRTPGSVWRMIFVHLSNGAQYRIDLLRGNSDWTPRVTVFRRAPFIKRK